MQNPNANAPLGMHENGENVWNIGYEICEPPKLTLSRVYCFPDGYFCYTKIYYLKTLLLKQWTQ